MSEPRIKDMKIKEINTEESESTVSVQDLKNSDREVIDKKLRQYFDGKIVRKDLTKHIKEGANVPIYVLEYLLGQYCNSDDEVLMMMLTFHSLILQNIKIQTMLLSWQQTGCAIILRFHFWTCGNKFTIPILNLSNSIGLKQNLEIMLLH